MPTGIYKRRKWHGQKISKALKLINWHPPIKKGEKSSNWKGGRIDRSGYIYIRVGKKYVAEHRIVMEKHINRPLGPQEVIHHINHNKKDNRIENLELCKSRGQHTLKHHPEVYEKASKVNKGVRRSLATEFKKGQIPWNKKIN